MFKVETVVIILSIFLSGCMLTQKNNSVSHQKTENLEYELKKQQRKAELLEQHRIYLLKKRKEELDKEDLILSSGLGRVVCNDGPMTYWTDAVFNVEQVAKDSQIVAIVESIDSESRRIEYKVSSFYANIPDVHERFITTGFYYKNSLVRRGEINWDSVKGWYPCRY